MYMTCSHAFMILLILSCSKRTRDTGQFGLYFIWEHCAAQHSTAERHKLLGHSVESFQWNVR